MRLHSYIVEHDMGFAPNPFHGVCTLATCKPKIRKYAKLGEYVIGTGTKKRNLQGRLVYVMRISEISTFDQYWLDKRFDRKKPVMNGSLMQRYGDNMYHHAPGSNEWTQEDSFHSQKGGLLDIDNLTVDTGTTDRVLVGDWFIYWGGDGPLIPQQFNEIVLKGIGNKYVDDAATISTFLNWASSMAGPGVRGEPCEWKHLKTQKKSRPAQAAAPLEPSRQIFARST